MPPRETNETREENQSLWLLTAAPTLWAAHFLLSYITAAVWCAKYAGPDGSLSPVRRAIAVYTLVTLLAIGATAAIAWRRYSYDGARADYAADTPAGRHRFMGHAALLLSILSAVATVYAALAAVFIRSCY